MDNKLSSLQEYIFEKMSFFSEILVWNEIPAYKKLNFTDSGKRVE